MHLREHLLGLLFHCAGATQTVDTHGTCGARMELAAHVQGSRTRVPPGAPKVSAVPTASDTIGHPNALEESENLEALLDLEDLNELDALEGELGGVANRRRPPSFRGFATSTFRLYLADRDAGLPNEQLLLESEAEISADLAPNVRMVLRPWFLVDALNSTLVRYEPLEWYVEYWRGNWDIGAGQFLTSFGVADILQPTDVFNRKDYGSDILRPRKRGDLGVRARYVFWEDGVIGQPTISAYVRLLWRPTVFPHETSRSFLGSEGTVLDRPERPPYGESILAVLRMDHTVNGRAARADVQYVVSRGPEGIPVFAPSASEPSSTVIVPQYFAAWVAGAGFRLVPTTPGWSKFTFRAEAAAHIPYPIETVELAFLPDPYLQYVAGLNVTLDRGPHNVTITAEYAGENFANDPTKLLRPFDSDIALGVTWSAGDAARTSLTQLVAVDVRNGETIIDGTIQRQLRFIHEGLGLSLGWRGVIPSRRTDPTLLALLPNESRLEARLSFAF